jgi:hypothetical protein
VSGKFLATAIAPSDHIDALIKQSAENLGSVNADIKHALANSDADRTLPEIRLSLPTPAANTVSV